MKSINLSNKINSGFTIIELIVVILVVGIIAGISVVGYIGISQNTIVASLKSDLSNASDQLKAYKLDNGKYPSANNCTSSAPPNICLTPSSDNMFLYTSDSPNTTFALIATNVSVKIAYRITSNTIPTGTIYSEPTCNTGWWPPANACR